MKGIGEHRHSFADRQSDVYETPQIAVETLLCVEFLPAVIWEPACGPGAIVRVLRDHGHSVIASDLHDYPGTIGGTDFLQEREVPIGVEAIVTNPPYRLGQEFVEHALDLGVPMVAMLLRLGFLESSRRERILDGGKLARVHVFKRRLPMMHRAGWDGPRATSSICFAWFVWKQDHKGPTQLFRV